MHTTGHHKYPNVPHAVPRNASERIGRDAPNDSASIQYKIQGTLNGAARGPLRAKAATLLSPMNKSTPPKIIREWVIEERIRQPRREIEMAIDGKPVGLVWPHPYIYASGVNR